MTPLFLCRESLYLTDKYPLIPYHRFSSVGLRGAALVLRSDASGVLVDETTSLLLRARNYRNVTCMVITDEGS
jgi:hypothetical protein